MKCGHLGRKKRGTICHVCEREKDDAAAVLAPQKQKFSWSYHHRTQLWARRTIFPDSAFVGKSYLATASSSSTSNTYLGCEIWKDVFAFAGRVPSILFCFQRLAVCFDFDDECKRRTKLGGSSTFVVLGRRRRLGGKKLLRNGETPPAFMICCCERSCQLGKWGWAERKSVCCTEYHSTFFPSHASSPSLYSVLPPATHAVVLRCMLQCDAMRCKILTNIHCPCPLASIA